MSCIVVFDIETVALPVPERIQQGILDGKVRVDKVTKDPKKIYEKLKEKYWTQPEGRKPIAIGFALLDMEKREIAETRGCQSESKDELAAFVMDTFTVWPPNKLIGYNSEHFDFPSLERLVRGVKGNLPYGVGRWDHIDMMYKIPQFFNNPRPLKNSPISACSLYGIDDSNDKTTGADVAKLWDTDRQKGTKVVLSYCLKDVEKTAQLFFKCSKLRNLL